MSLPCGNYSLWPIIIQVQRKLLSIAYKQGSIFGVITFGSTGVAYLITLETHYFHPRKFNQHSFAMLFYSLELAQALVLFARHSNLVVGAENSPGLRTPFSALREVRISGNNCAAAGFQFQSECSASLKLSTLCPWAKRTCTNQVLPVWCASSLAN